MPSCEHDAVSLQLRLRFPCSGSETSNSQVSTKTTGIPSCTLLLMMASALAGMKGPAPVDWGIVPSDGLISRGGFPGRRLAPCQESVRKSSPRTFALPYAVCRIPYACSLLLPAGKFALLYAGGLALFALAKILESRRHESPLSHAHAACLLWR